MLKRLTGQIVLDWGSKVCYNASSNHCGVPMGLMLDQDTLSAA